MRATRLFLCALLAAALAGAGLAARGPEQAGAARPAGLTWDRCAEESAADCATLRVPVDYADPYGARIDVAVARRAATDRAGRLGVLIVNPGGPGESGVDFAYGAPSYFSADLLRRFDIVGFDPRGVARSHPVRCSVDLSAAAPNPLAPGAPAYTALVRHNRELAADCRGRTGPLVDHADTLSVVRDLDALRQALGEDTLSFYGISYGTLLGQQYLARYPQRVRALALDSVLDHSLGTRDFLDSEAVAAQAAFGQFVAWCARDELCALRGRDVRAVWTNLLGRAAAGSLPDPIDPARRLDPFALISVAFASFYGPDWYALAYYLDAAAAGRAPATRAARAAVARIARWTADPAATGVENPFAAAFCADWALPTGGPQGYAALLRRSARFAPDMRVSPLGLSSVAACLGSPVRTVNPQRPAPRAGSPVLLINARFDPATPVAWAQRVAGQLGPQARLVTYQGWGHAAYARSACTSGVVDAYLLTRALPKAGTTCAAVEPEPWGVGRRSQGPRPGVPGW